MNLFNKVIACTLAFLLMNLMCVDAYANQKDEYSIDRIQHLLESSAAKQTIVVSEAQIMKQLIAGNEVTRNQLKKELSELSRLSIIDLRNKGYTISQIESIKAYDGNIDALEYAIKTSSDAKLTFSYGLAGSDNTRKSVRIAYDIRWSSCPLFTFTDSFGIGWVAADRSSYELATKITETVGIGVIYNFNDEVIGTRDVDMDTHTAGVVTGTIPIGSAGGNFVKNIGGLVMVETQSGSYNMDTIQIFVAYAHTVLSFHISAGVRIQYKKVGPSISFTPTLRQKMLVEGNSTFKFNSQDVITLYH